MEGWTEEEIRNKELMAPCGIILWCLRGLLGNEGRE